MATWECVKCHNFVLSHPSLCDLCRTPRPVDASGAPAGTGDSAAILGKRDLAIEAHVRAVAIWYRAGAAIVGASTLLFALVMLNDAMEYTRGRGARMLAIAIPLLITEALCAGMFVIGTRLSRFSEFGRIAGAVAEGLLGLVQLWGIVAAILAHDGVRLGVTVVQTLVSGAWIAAVMLLLLSKRAAAICTPSYRELVADRTDQQPPIYGSPFFWVPFIGVALFVGLMLLGGLLMSASQWR